MAQSKLQRTVETGDVYSTEPKNRINALPEKLLCCILAILSTKEAVATSILSERWKYVWTGVPVLNFTDFPPPTKHINKVQYVCYKNFVIRVLFLNNAFCLERVHLECHEGFSQSSVYEWTLALAKRCIKELCLTTNLRLPIKLPSNLLLDKDKLVVLKLEGKLKLSLPSSIHLPLLKILSLTSVTFQDESDPFTRLLSCSPVLEELNVDLCQGFDEISVCSSSLRVLRFISFGCERETMIIKAPKIQILYLSMCIKQSCIDYLSSLAEARLVVSTSTVRWVVLLQRFHNLKTLVLHQIILDGDNAVNKLPIFLNLTNLEVSFTPWPIVLQLIRNAPNLACLIIHKLMFDWPEIMPRIKELVLERIEFHSFDVSEGHLEILKFFLNNSKLLKEFKVYIQCWIWPISEIRILKTLLELPRASTICQISIVSRDDDDVFEEPGNESDYTSSWEDEEEDEDEEDSSEDD